jgi:hypothetical protein
VRIARLWYVRNRIAESVYGVSSQSYSYKARLGSVSERASLELRYQYEALLAIPVVKGEDTDSAETP